MSFLKKTSKAAADIIPGLGVFTFDPNIGKVFITSGTGVIGYRVAMSLLEAGHMDVRVGVWRGAREAETSGISNGNSFANNVAKALEEKGAEVVNFDWSNEEGHAEILAGVKTVFCTIPYMDHWADVFPPFLMSCKKAKVEHFIKTSFLRNLPHTNTSDLYRENVPFVQFHNTCDHFLENAKWDSRISFTILATSHVMSTPLLHQGPLLRKEHKFVTASYGMGVNYVSPNDIADAAVVVILNRKEHKNKVYNLTGPRPIKDREVAELLTKHYGKHIEHIELGYHDYKESVKRRGLPSWLIRDSAEFERMKASGIDEKPFSYTKDLERLIGKPPETFRDYLDNKSCMRPGLTFP